MASSEAVDRVDRGEGESRRKKKKSSMHVLSSPESFSPPLSPQGETRKKKKKPTQVLSSPESSSPPMSPASPSSPALLDESSIPPFSSLYPPTYSSPYSSYPSSSFVSASFVSSSSSSSSNGGQELESEGAPSHKGKLGNSQSEIDSHSPSHITHITILFCSFQSSQSRTTCEAVSHFGGSSRPTLA